MQTRYIEQTKKTGNELFYFDDSSINITLVNFWSWAYSDITINTARGKLAEFIVATALGISDNITTAWDSFDLSFMGKGVEVKSSAYLQSWYQEKESEIKFDIKATKGWSATTGKYEDEQKRQSYIYVFCLLNHKDKTTLNPLHINQWEFFVVPTSVLNALVPTQKKVSLSFFRKYKIDSCRYSDLKSAFEKHCNS